MAFFNPEPEGAGRPASGQRRLRRDLVELSRRCDDLSDFLDNATVGLHCVALDGTILWVNSAELAMLGYSRSEFVGRNIKEFHPDPAEVLDVLRRLESGDTIAACEGVMRRADGTLIDVLVDSSVRREDGRFLYTRCITRDNTEAKRAAMALKESERKYRAVFEASLDGMVIIDDSGRVVDINDALCRMLGLSSQVAGQHYTSLMPPFARDEAVALFEQLRSRGTFQGRIPMFTTKGDVLRVEWNSQAYFLPGLHVCVARDVTEQARTEEQLRRSHERYRVFVAQSSEGIWRVELLSPIDTSLPPDEQIRRFYESGVLAECNVGFSLMYGYERPDDLAGARLTDLMPPTRHNLEYLRSFIRSGYRLTGAESHERDRQGNPRQFLNNLVGVVEEGKLLRAWGTQRDITEQHRTERRLWDAQSRLALRNGILAGSASGVSVEEVIRQTVEQVHLCFPEHRCCYATVRDDGALRISCAFEPEGMEALDGASIDLTGALVYLDTLRRCETVIADDVALDERFESVQSAFKARAVLDAPLSQDGELGGVLSFHAPEPHVWSDHEIATLREVARDLAAAIRKATDREARRRAQDALAASERRLRLALGAGRMVSWECDIASGALSWTPASNPPPGALPANLGELIEHVHEEDRERVLHSIRKACDGAGQFQVEYRVASPDGSVQWIESRGELHRDGDNERAILVGISSDISDRRRSEEAVRHRQKLESLGVLAGGVAHDFNNLLTGILGNSTLAAEMLDQEHPAHALMQDVCLAGERAAELTSQLLAYAGRGRYVLAPLDLSALVRDTCRLLQLSIPKKTTLRLDLAPDLPRLQADRGQLQQIVMNLVMNAGEAAGKRERPEIRVSTRVAKIDEAWLQRMAPAGGIEPGSYLMLSVEDNGTGMDEATKARIFDPFFTTKATGRGLGLAAVHGIVRAHHGGLAVTSAPGWGTVFEILFPVTGAAQPKPAGSRVVLLISMDDAVHQGAADLLESMGYAMVASRPGPAALEVLRDRQEIAAVLVDEAVAETLSEVREVRPELPVLLTDGEFTQTRRDLQELLSRITTTTNGAKAAAAAGDASLPADAN